MGDIVSLAQRCPQLQALYLDDSELTLDAMRVLGTAMRKRVAFQSLKSLSLCSCELTAAAAVHIARCVVQCS